MTDLLSLVESRGIRMRRVGRKNGGEYAGGCPFCGDSGKADSDRFHVWPQQRSNVSEGTFWCRQCGKRGDTVNFIMQTSGITFRDACLRLNIQLPESRALRTPTPAASPGATVRPRSIDPPSATWRDRAKKFVAHAYTQIWDNETVLTWLAKRGIQEYSIAKYGIGYNPKDYWRPRSAWGLPPVTGENGKPKMLWLPVGVVIPQVTKGGDIWRIRIRREGEIKFGARYYVVPGSAMGCLWYGFGRVAVIVESELDAVAIASAVGDLVSAVALGSAQAKPDEQAAAMLRDCIEILVALDSDKAGAQSSAWWLEQYPKARLWPVPDGKDPGDAVKANVDLRAWVMAGLPPAFHV